MMTLLNSVQFNRTPTHRDDASADRCCTASRRLEDRGEYREAQELLSDFCPEIGTHPQVESLSPDLQAEVKLRVGVVFGFVASAEAIEGGGQFARELINAALDHFTGLSIGEKAGECHLELGRLSWRAGLLDEAEKYFKTALRFLPDTALRLRAKTYLRLGIVYSSSHRYQDALALYDSVDSLFMSLEASDIIRASYHNERAAIFHSLATSENREEFLNKALVEYTASLFHGKKAKHKRHCALVENNIAHLLFLLGQFPKGFAHLERAGRMFKSLGDVRTYSQVEETRAQALIEQGHYPEAERALAGTIHTLEKAGEVSLLCENLITYSTALSRQSKGVGAYKALMRAVNEATSVDDSASAGRAWLVMLEEVGSSVLSPEQCSSALREAMRLLEDSQEPKIQSRLLSCAVSLATQNMASRSKAPTLEQLEGVPLKEAVRKFKAHYIRQALETANGNQSVAARILGMTASGLNALLKGTHKDVHHEGMKKYNKTLTRPAVDEVAAHRARKTARSTIARKPGSAEIRLKTNHLLSLGPGAGDWVVAEEGEVAEGDLAAVLLKTGKAAVGYYRLTGKRIILEVRSLPFGDYEFDENEVARVIGKVYGWLKADEEDSEIVRLFN